MKSIDILLAEDSFTDAELAREAFKEGDIPYTLSIVKDGEEALKYLRENCCGGDRKCPDLVILDLNMPKKTGHEVLAEMKKDDELRTIPVIILTTSSDARDVQRCYEFHASCYVTKPDDFDRFAEVTKEIKHFYSKIATLPSMVGTTD